MMLWPWPRPTCPGKMSPKINNSMTVSKGNYPATAKLLPTTRPVGSGPNPFSMEAQLCSVERKLPIVLYQAVEALAEIKRGLGDGVG